MEGGSQVTPLSSSLFFTVILLLASLYIMRPFHQLLLIFSLSLVLNNLINILLGVVVFSYFCAWSLLHFLDLWDYSFYQT
jgi:hypothetical protein